MKLLEIWFKGPRFPASSLERKRMLKNFSFKNLTEKQRTKLVFQMVLGHSKIQEHTFSIVTSSDNVQNEQTWCN